MAAKIIKLDRFRSGVRCEPLGLFFPVVYRLTGFGFSECGNFADKRYPSIQYTLAEEPGVVIADPRYQAITRLDPVHDDGWVMVRHHRSREALSGYLDGLQDLEAVPHAQGVTYESNDGLFTIVQRDPVKGCPNHLLIYAATTDDDDYDGDCCWTKVVTSTGEVTDDEVLYPPGMF